MDLKQVTKDTAKVLASYLTYQALRLTLAQLSETNPPLSLWLHRFCSNHSVQDGEMFLEALLRENQELAFRLMTVREHMAEEVTEFLPELVKTTIHQSNMDRRRQHLERITQLTVSDPPAPPDRPDSEIDNRDR